MVPLPLFPLPLPSQPPDGYGCVERDCSAFSTTTFETSIDRRDKFLGRKRCVICGCDDSIVLQHVIIVDEADHFWPGLTLGRCHWIPSRAEENLPYDPRNGLLMCANHQLLFDGCYFFIRFLPDVQKYVLVNYSGRPGLQSFHGKAIALDIKDHHAPSPALFIIHEMCVRGCHPFTPLDPDMPKDSPWQDWIESDGIFDKDSGSFRRNCPPPDNSVTVQPPSWLPFATTNAGGTSSGQHTLPLNADVVADILAASRAMPSWKACEEGD
ncbi:hypothetical protein EDB89DRAFT_2111861 [Lactarius sanguifluus]|nr:hypothetical protein EDB89DRAFT_2111861 [Lactarius sanguifluus]